jgi:hypothetical protein
MCPYSKKPCVILRAFSNLQGFCGFKKSIDQKIKKTFTKSRIVKKGITLSGVLRRATKRKLISKFHWVFPFAKPNRGQVMSSSSTD